MTSFCVVVPGAGATFGADAQAAVAAAMSRPVHAECVSALRGGALVAQGSHPSLPGRREPLSLDGVQWLVGGIRLDEPQSLRAALAAHGVTVPTDTEDAMLAWHAHRLWGAECISRLRGDFAFAVWDERTHSLFAARDHLGIGQCYHASPSGAGSIAVAGSIAPLRALPGVRAVLDEGAIGEFLVLGQVHDSSATAFLDVRALAPAHVLCYAESHVRVSAYWSIAHVATNHAGTPRELGLQFRALLEESCRDRLRDVSSAALLLSGGRDSPAVAVAARFAMGDAFPLSAWTFDSGDSRDEEPPLAAIVARGLGMRHEVRLVDTEVFASWSDRSHPRDIPVDRWLGTASLDAMREIARESPVVLTGYGGDALLRETVSHLARLLRSGQWVRAGREGLAYASLHRRIPRPGFRSLRRLREPAPVEIPHWLDRTFVERTSLRDRLARGAARDYDRHTRRPEASFHLANPIWPRLAESLAPAETGIPLLARHPLLDLRLVEFVLGVAPVQWYNDKGLVTAGFSGSLGGEILHRPKTPAADVALPVSGVARVSVLDAVRFVASPADVPQLRPTDDEANAVVRRLYSLAAWMAAEGLSG